MSTITAIEGYFVETRESLIFDVKGILHPQKRIIAFLRYYPSPNGVRVRNNTKYSKIYQLSDRFKFLQNHFPQYLFQDQYSGQILQGIPHKDIKKIYDPIKTVKLLLKKNKLSNLEKASISFIKILGEGVDSDSIGISGSLMVGLQTLKSDIDIVVYGKDTCYEVHKYLADIIAEREHGVRPMNIEELQDLHYFRNQQTEIALSSFVQLERRKHISGMYNDREFFMRFVKAPQEIDEIYEDYCYEQIGYAILKGKISDASEAIFTPSRYSLEDTRIIDGVQVEDVNEIVSFRGRFCEQAKNGETIIARGKIEKVTKKDGSHWYQMVLGERRDDFFMPIQFSERALKTVGVI